MVEVGLWGSRWRRAGDGGGGEGGRGRHRH